MATNKEFLFSIQEALNKIARNVDFMDAEESDLLKRLDTDVWNLADDIRDRLDNNEENSVSELAQVRIEPDISPDMRERLVALWESNRPMVLDEPDGFIGGPGSGPRHKIK